jgi:hypothetical protein
MPCQKFESTLEEKRLTEVETSETHPWYHDGCEASPVVLEGKFEERIWLIFVRI